MIGQKTCLRRPIMFEHEKQRECLYCLNGEFGDFTIGPFVGAGYSGTVYQVRHNPTRALYVAKFLALEETDAKTSSICVNTARNEFEKEWKKAANLGELGLAPTVFYVTELPSVLDADPNTKQAVRLGVIISEKWDLSLREYIDQHPAKFKANEEKIDALILALAQNYIKHDLYHADVHARNIVLKLDAEFNVQNLTFIDFNGFALQDKLELQRKSVRKLDMPTRLSRLVQEMIIGAKEEPAV